MGVNNVNLGKIYKPEICRDERNRDMSLGGKDVTDPDYAEKKIEQQLGNLAALGKTMIQGKNAQLDEADLYVSYNSGNIDKFINNDGHRINTPDGFYEYHTNQDGSLDATIMQKNSGATLCEIKHNNKGFIVNQLDKTIANYDAKKGTLTDKNGDIVAQMLATPDGGFCVKVPSIFRPAGKYNPDDNTVSNGSGTIIATDVKDAGEARMILLSLLVTDLAKNEDNILRQK